MNGDPGGGATSGSAEELHGWSRAHAWLWSFSKFLFGGPKRLSAIPYAEFYNESPILNICHPYAEFSNSLNKFKQ